MSTLRAEQAFREAFIRLKDGCPIRMVPGSRVSQNNVAKEAGCDPSALKKLRYPELVGEIQSWVSAHLDASTARDTSQGDRESAANSLRKRLARLKDQRDALLSQLLEADAKIVELASEVDRLQKLLSSREAGKSGGGLR